MNATKGKQTLTTAKFVRNAMAGVDAKTKIRVTHSDDYWTITVIYDGDLHPEHFDTMHTLQSLYAPIKFHLLPEWAV